MKRITILSAVAAFAASFGAAAAIDGDTYTIDGRHTFPQYEVVHFGTSLQRGRFDKTEGKLVYDAPAHKGSVEISHRHGFREHGRGQAGREPARPGILQHREIPEDDFQVRRLGLRGRLR